MTSLNLKPVLDNTKTSSYPANICKLMKYTLEATGIRCNWFKSQVI